MRVYTEVVIDISTLEETKPMWRLSTILVLSPSAKLAEVAVVEELVRSIIPITWRRCTPRGWMMSMATWTQRLGTRRSRPLRRTIQTLISMRWTQRYVHSTLLLARSMLRLITLRTRTQLRTKSTTTWLVLRRSTLTSLRTPMC